MSIPGYDALMHYATPPTNYIGASIFLSYIAAALYATITITYSLYTQYTTLFTRTTNDEKLNAAKAARARYIKTYAFVASISFATLSYHMLMFLITHYLAWTSDSNASLSSVSTESLRMWMLESALFQDFATELVRDAPNAMWTQSAILATWFWNMWMAQKARERRITASTMRTYVLLGQILPISFTAALFAIQLHLAAPDIQTPAPPQVPTQSQPVPARSERKVSLQLPNILLNVSLLASPFLRGHPVFISLILFERAILLLPHSGLLRTRDAEVVKCVAVSGGFMVATAAMMRRELSLAGIVAALGEGGYAVKALGWDAVLGGIMFGVWGRGGGV